MKNNPIFFIAAIIVILLCLAVTFSGCGVAATSGSAPNNAASDRQATLQIGDKMAANQPTPTDIDYSLERYNLIRRTYWVNGQREKATALICPIERPLGYIVLITDGGAVVGSFVVDGKVTSLNSFLTPDSEYYEAPYKSDANGGSYSSGNKWLPDVDGSYGENDAGIFFFTPDGRYIEWTGTYLYSDIPFIVDDPVVRYEVAK